MFHCSTQLTRIPLLSFSAASLLLSLTSSLAGDRKFTYTYEANTAPKGTWELEQWATFRDSDDSQSFRFRTELEYGVTENLQLGFYLSDWRYTKLDDGSSKAKWDAAGVEAIYRLTDPNTSAIGSALYGEVLVGPGLLELEAKLLLQKNFGPLTVAYNFVVESEWEGEKLSSLDEVTGEIQNTLGVSYQLSPSFLIGAEALHEVEIADWSDAGDHVFYVGPNMSFRSGNFFATVTGLFQVSDVAGEPETQVRLITGFDF